MQAEEIQPYLDLWAETDSGVATLINLSENHTFRIEGEHGRFILRVHRPGYQSPASIESELAWLTALRQETPLRVPRALPGRDGRLVQRLGQGSAARHAVLFAHEAGREPTPDEPLGELFATLGRCAAIAHRHAEKFRPVGRFDRQTWTAAAILDGTGPWGDWRAGPGVDESTRPRLEALAARLHAELAAYGTAPGRFGLIHADMRLANLLVDGDRMTLIDFDDCGFCWFMYDFAAAISFFEQSPAIPELKRRWVVAYTAIRPLDQADIAILDSMVLLRRLALLAFLGSHPETDLARQHGAGFALTTVALAGP